MTYTPSNKEFEALQNTDIDKRLKHFKNRVGGHCYFWLLCSNENNLLACYDGLGRKCIPVWPAKEYGELVLNFNKNINNIDANCLKSMEIYHFLDNYIDELIESDTYVFVFPNKELDGAIMTAESFRNIMEEELAKYGDYDDEYENNSIEKRLGRNSEIGSVSEI
jgi:hypothetical protein